MQLTYWHWQFSASKLNARYLTSYDAFAEGIRNLIPAEMNAGVMVKSHSGDAWQNTFDPHPLAISGPAALESLARACGRQEVALGVWGEASTNPSTAGQLAGQSSAIAGYYCLDLEPYKEFRLPTVPDYTAEYVADWALHFWYAFKSHGGAREHGASIAPQKSGVEPFSRPGLLAWLHECSYLHLQTYWASYPNLHADIARQYVSAVLDRLILDPKIIYIVEPASVTEALARPDVSDHLEVWRI